ncbi:hypothetical protein ALFP_2806 [Alcaligenes faecalis]|nr:hypothetical protein ALFP_2806 [Alcaligenes faecalis]
MQGIQSGLVLPAIAHSCHLLKANLTATFPYNT